MRIKISIQKSIYLIGIKNINCKKGICIKSSEKVDRTKIGTKESTKESSYVCSNCGKLLIKGEEYTESILSGKILCSECEEGLFIDEDTFFSID